MSRNSVSALILLLVLLAVSAAPAQEDTEEKVFKLSRGGLSPEQQLEVENELEVWEPAITPGDLELSFFLGFMNLNTTLLAHDQIIYKYTDLSTFWGDVKIKGQSSFSPSLRLNYNLSRWFSIEGNANFSIGDYITEITNRSERPNGENTSVSPDEPVLGEFDAEKRSLASFIGSVNAVCYPLNIKGDGKGRLHPYASVGFGRAFYNMNSDYTDGTATSWDYSLGAGVRFLADKTISLRAEIAYHHNTAPFTPAPYFKSLDEGSKIIPLNEYPKGPDGTILERVVTEYETSTINSLQWSIGFQATF